MNENLSFLDLLTIMSFALQIQNQAHIIDLADVQDEINKAVADIHGHLKEQDEKLERILKHENHTETER